MGQQFLVFAEGVCGVVCGDGFERIRKLLQPLDFRGFVCCWAGFGLQQLNALVGGLQCRSWAREQAFLHTDALQFLLLASAVFTTLGELHGKQGAVGRLFLGTGCLA